MEKYTLEYFIEKFEAIPEREIGELSINKHCALWHCGVKEGGDHITPEANALIKLFGGSEGEWTVVTAVNDDYGDFFTSPKNRILKKLRSLRPKKSIWKRIKGYFSMINPVYPF